MRNTADLSPVAPLPFHHASAQEWETFVQHYATSKKYQGALLLSRRQFIELRRGRGGLLHHLLERPGERRQFCAARGERRQHGAERAALFAGRRDEQL